MNNRKDSLKLGIEAFEANDFGNAEKLLKQVMKEKPVLGALWLSKVYQNTDRCELGIKLLTDVLSIADESERGTVVVTLANLYCDHNDYQRALDLFQRAYDGGDKKALVKMVHCLVHLGNDSEAEMCAQKAVEDGDESACEILGDLYIKRGFWQGAATQLQKVYPKKHSVAYKLGMSLMQMDRHSECIPYLKEGIKHGYYGILKNLLAVNVINRQNRNAIALGLQGEKIGAEGILSFIGVAYKNINQWDKAIEYLKKAIKAKEPLTLVFYQLAFCYMETGRYTDAIKALKEAEKQHDDGIWNARGHVYWKSGKLSYAIRCFKKSTVEEPELALSSSFSLGKLYHSKGDDVSAAQYFQDAWSGGFLPGGVALGDFAFNDRDFATAALWYQKVYDRGYKEALYPLGHAHRLLGHFTKAKECFLQCLEQGDNRARIGLALIATAEKNYEEAASIYEMCIENKLEGANKLYGRFLAEQGDYFSAIAYLTMALEVDKDLEVAGELSKLYEKAEFPLKSAEKAEYYAKIAEQKRKN